MSNENNDKDATIGVSDNTTPKVSNEIETLSALELNNIKLDPRHTLLTPDYLENLIQEKRKE